MAKSVVIRQYRQEDIEGIFRLMKDVWGDHHTALVRKKWNWLYHNNPCIFQNTPIAFILELDSKIIGFTCNLLSHLKVLDKTIKARWGSESAVHQGYRGNGLTLGRTSKNFPHYPVFFNSSPKILKIFSKLGFSTIARIDSRLLIMNTYSVLKIKLKNKIISRILSIPLSLGLGIFLNKKNSRLNIDLNEIKYFDERFNEFWQKINGYYNIIVVRNAQYLNWRFIKSPIEHKVFAAAKNNSILGYIVLKSIDYSGLKVGRIIDILAYPDDEKTIDILLNQAITYFKGINCDIAECMILTDKKAYLNALAKHGFLFRKRGSYFGVFTKDPQQRSCLIDPKNWFITTADPDMDSY